MSPKEQLPTTQTPHLGKIYEMMCLCRGLWDNAREQDIKIFRYTQSATCCERWMPSTPSCAWSLEVSSWWESAAQRSCEGWRERSSSSRAPASLWRSSAAPSSCAAGTSQSRSPAQAEHVNHMIASCQNLLPTPLTCLFSASSLCSSSAFTCPSLLYRLTHRHTFT